MTQRKIDYWVIPTEADAEFVASMEEVLETYAQPHDPPGDLFSLDPLFVGTEYLLTHFGRAGFHAAAPSMPAG